MIELESICSDLSNQFKHVVQIKKIVNYTHLKKAKYKS